MSEGVSAKYLSQKTNLLLLNCRFIFWAMKGTIVAYLILFGILPIIFHYSYTIQRKILFLNFGNP